MKVGDLLIDESEIVESFVRASGPGGQNVNKVASAVELRFDARALAEPAQRRRGPADQARRRARHPGWCDRHLRAEIRQPAAQPEDARARLAALLAKAQERPKLRRATRPTLASRARRLDEKTRRGAVKALRRRTTGAD